LNTWKKIYFINNSLIINEENNIFEPKSKKIPFNLKFTFDFKSISNYYLKRRFFMIFIFDNKLIGYHLIEFHLLWRISFHQRNHFDQFQKGKKIKSNWKSHLDFDVVQQGKIYCITNFFDKWWINANIHKSTKFHLFN
jgi:hypothetical protein